MAKIYAVKRGKKYHYYYRYSWRVKLSDSKEGKGPGSGPSRVVTRNIYLGKAEDIVKKVKGENISLN